MVLTSNKQTHRNDTKAKRTEMDHITKQRLNSSMIDRLWMSASSTPPFGKDEMGGLYQTRVPTFRWAGYLFLRVSQVTGLTLALQRQGKGIRFAFEDKDRAVQA